MLKIGIISTALLLLILLVSCGKPKKALLASEFQTQMALAGYDVFDVSEQFVEEESYESVQVAYTEDTDYQIEFYVLSSENQAMQAFNNVQAAFESEKGTSSSYSSVSLSNYSKYTQTTNGRYYVVSRIGNTFLYAITGSENKKEINDALKALGY